MCSLVKSHTLRPFTLYSSVLYLSSRKLENRQQRQTQTPILMTLALSFRRRDDRGRETRYTKTSVGSCQPAALRITPDQSEKLTRIAWRADTQNLNSGSLTVDDSTNFAEQKSVISTSITWLNPPWYVTIKGSMFWTSFDPARTNVSFHSSMLERAAGTLSSAVFCRERDKNPRLVQQDQWPKLEKGGRMIATNMTLNSKLRVRHQWHTASN